MRTITICMLCLIALASCTRTDKSSNGEHKNSVENFQNDNSTQEESAVSITSKDLNTFNLKGNVHYVIRDGKDTIMEFTKNGELIYYYYCFPKNCKVKRDNQNRLTDIDDDVIITGFEYEDGKVVIVKHGIDGEYECCDASYDSLFYSNNGNIIEKRNHGSNSDCNWEQSEKYSEYKYDSEGNWISRKTCKYDKAQFYGENFNEKGYDSISVVCDTIIEKRRIEYYK